jgi:hypothetical protein
MLQPGEALGEVLNRHNTERLYLRARSDKSRWENLKHALVANALGCFGSRSSQTRSDLALVQQIQTQFPKEVKDIESGIRAAEGKRSRGSLPYFSDTQTTLLKVLGIDLEKDVRLDRVAGHGLGTDFTLRSEYLPNGNGQRDPDRNRGYPTLRATCRT